MGEFTILAEEQRHTLERLASILRGQQLYLAGGTAIAYHLHHRRSLDLDLFGQSIALNLEVVREVLTKSIRNLKVISVSDATLRVRVDTTPVDIVRYPYPPLITPEPGPGNFPVAGLIDLATMKLAAIARRGIRRDFWDLYEIADASVPLREALDAYASKFGDAEADLYHVLRALTYFDDAEKETVFPAGLTSQKWEVIKTFFRVGVPPLLVD